MRRFAWRFLAAASLTILAATAIAELRPRYGGTLVIELHDSLTLTDPADWPVRLVPLVYDCLVRLDEHGEPQAELAISWQHDAANKHWEFRLRPPAAFHDGTPVTAAAVVASLTNWKNATASGESVVIFESEVPAPDLPVRLASPHAAILLRPLLEERIHQGRARGFERDGSGGSGWPTAAARSSGRSIGCARR